jgi:hypothetical protein
MNVNQTYSFSQSHSLVYVQDQSGLEFINKGIYIYIYIYSGVANHDLQKQFLLEWDGMGGRMLLRHFLING